MDQLPVLLASWLTAAAALRCSLVVSMHIIFCKRDSRSAVAWIAVVWLVPFLGSLLYYLLGINRIQRRARRPLGKGSPPKPVADAMGMLPVARISSRFPKEAQRAISRISSSSARRSPGNRSAKLYYHGREPLWDGDQAYPAILQAIAGAKHSVVLSMYIYNNDRTGKRIAEDFGRASSSGVGVSASSLTISARGTIRGTRSAGRCNVRASLRPGFCPRSGRAPLPTRISATTAS